MAGEMQCGWILKTSALHADSERVVCIYLETVIAQNKVVGMIRIDNIVRRCQNHGALRVENIGKRDRSS